MSHDHFSLSQKDNWETPQELFDLLNSIYNFTVDACAVADNTKCARFFENAFHANWAGERVFMNPPYGKGVTSKFVEKAYKEVYEGECPVCVLIIPNATETIHFQKLVDRGARIIFPKSRVSFIDPETKKPVHGNTKGTAIVVISKTDELGFNR